MAGDDDVTPPVEESIVDPSLPGGPPTSSTVLPDVNKTITEPDISKIVDDSPTSVSNKVMEKVLPDTLAILRVQQEHIAIQKTFLSQLSFILNKIRESIELYNTTTEKLNTFLVNNEMMQSALYANYCRWCPIYGDYVEVFTESAEPIQVEGLAGKVPENELKNLVDDVTKVFYASGLEVKNHRMVCKSINSAMQKRRSFYKESMNPFSAWFQLLNIEMENQNTLSDQLFRISAFIDFVKADDNNPPPVLDLSSIGDGHIL